MGSHSVTPKKATAIQAVMNLKSFFNTLITETVIFEIDLDLFVHDKKHFYGRLNC